jgi:hypothetical protein
LLTVFKSFCSTKKKVSAEWWSDRHLKHHSKTNVVGKDEDADHIVLGFRLFFRPAFKVSVFILLYASLYSERFISKSLKRQKRKRISLESYHTAISNTGGSQ